MKLSKDFIKGIRSGLSELGSDIYDILKENDYGNFSVYNGEGSGFVIDVKNRGIPDFDDISKLISKRTGVSVQKAYSLVVKIIDDLWRDETAFTYNNLNKEFNKNIVVVGRSGGYWGFDIDYFDISDFVIETEFFIEDNRDQIDELLENEEIENDLYGGMEFVADNFYSEDVVEYFSFSKTTMKVLDKFKTLLVNEIKEFEKPNMWADIIINNFPEQLKERAFTRKIY